MQQENTHIHCKVKHHCMADLLFCWFPFRQTSSKSVDNINPNKAAEPKPVKQEVS